VPAFYIGGEDLGRFLDHYTLRVLDHFGIREPGEPRLRWGDDAASSPEESFSARIRKTRQTGAEGGTATVESGSLDD